MFFKFSVSLERLYDQQVCQSTPQVRDTDHLFLELPLLKDKLEGYINNMSIAGCWSQNAIQATYAWLKEGLRSRCITRDLKWGVPVPHEKYKDKVGQDLILICRIDPFFFCREISCSIWFLQTMFETIYTTLIT